jgi:hypothetical protein
VNDIQRAMNPTLEEAIRYLKGMLFPQDFSPSTLKAVAVNKMAIAALEATKHGVWERMENPGGELEGFMCECRHQSNAASPYCSNCGRKMSGGEARK